MKAPRSAIGPTRADGRFNSDEMAYLLRASIEWILRGDDARLDHQKALERMAYLGHVMKLEGVQGPSLEAVAQREFDGANVNLWDHRRSFAKRFGPVATGLEQKRTS